MAATQKQSQISCLLHKYFINWTCVVIWF